MISLKEIQEFVIGIAKSGITEVDIDTEAVKLKLKFCSNSNNSIEKNVVQIEKESIKDNSLQIQEKEETQHNTSEFHQDIQNNPKYFTIKSPMVGTFYRKPSPDKPVFVNVGDEILSGKVICIIEAMKLFNEIEAEISGKIVKILVEDATPVEYDQPLFLIEQ